MKEIWRLKQALFLKLRFGSKTVEVIMVKFSTTVCHFRGNSALTLLNFERVKWERDSMVSVPNPISILIPRLTHCNPSYQIEHFKVNFLFVKLL